MVVWCMNQKKSMFVEEFKDWNLNLFKQANHLYCLDEIEKEQCKLARENFPPKYAYMLVTSLEDASSDSIAQPIENKKTHCRTVSIEEAMELWKEKNPVFAKFVERFNEE